MNNSLDKVFSIQDVSTDKVIIKVHADTPLTVAEYPFVASNYEYITVTRGVKHILTVVKDDGKTFDFCWGDGGYTLISDSLEKLKEAVIKFIEDNGIMLDYDGFIIDKPMIYYNHNYKKWQFTLYSTLRDDAFYWSDTATDFESMKKECEKFIKADNWEKGVGMTGIDHWTAKNYTLTEFNKRS